MKIIRNTISFILGTVMLGSTICNVSAYSAPDSLRNNIFQTIREYINSGMNNEEVLERLEDDTGIKILLTVRSGYDSEIHEFLIEKENVWYMPEFYKSEKDSSLLTCKWGVTVSELKEMMNEKWYDSFEFSISDFKTIEEIKAENIDDFYKVMNKVDSDTIDIYIQWNPEIEESELSKYLQPNTVVVDYLRYDDGVIRTLLSIPKTEAEKYIELYKDDAGEYVITKLFCFDDEPCTPSICGDLNSDNKIDVTDLSELSIALADGKEFTDEQQNAADVDGDGKVTLSDLARMRQYVSKIIEAF